MAYVTLQDAKDYCGITNAKDDGLLALLIAAAQAEIEAECGRVFEATADTTRYYNPSTSVDGRTLRLDGDLYSVTSITNGNTQTVTSAQYILEPLNLGPPYDRITLKVLSGVYWLYTTDPETAISIVGKWAYSVTPPPLVVEATKEMVKYLYKLRDSAVFDVTANAALGQITIPKGMPQHVRMALRSLRRRTF